MTGAALGDRPLWGDWEGWVDQGWLEGLISNRLLFTCVHSQVSSSGVSILWLAWRCAQPGSGHEQGRLRGLLCPLDVHNNCWRNRTSLSASALEITAFFLLTVSCPWGSLPCLLWFVALFWSSYFDLSAVLFPAWPASACSVHLSAISAVLEGGLPSEHGSQGVWLGSPRKHAAGRSQPRLQSVLTSQNFLQPFFVMQLLWWRSWSCQLTAVVWKQGVLMSAKRFTSPWHPLSQPLREFVIIIKKIIYSFISTKWLLAS